MATTVPLCVRGLAGLLDIRTCDSPFVSVFPGRLLLQGGFQRCPAALGISCSAASRTSFVTRKRPPHWCESYCKGPSAPRRLGLVFLTCNALQASFLMFATSSGVLFAIFLNTAGHSLGQSTSGISLFHVVSARKAKLLLSGKLSEPACCPLVTT